MNGHRRTRQLIADLTAGAGVGSAIAWALATVFELPLLAALCGAGIAFLRVFCSLRRKQAGPQFAIARFEPAALEFDTQGLAGDAGLFELDSLAASVAAEAVPVPLPVGLPTVKQMQASIRQRLHARDAVSGGQLCAQDSERGGPADAAAALRTALRDLRRSIG